MKRMTPILWIEGLGFFIVTVAIWLNEYFDLPHHLFGVMPMRFNYHEAIFESIFVLSLGAVVIIITKGLTKRIAQLESFLPICSFCKKIRRPDADPFKQESWQHIERYIGDRTGTAFSHGLCPECTEKHYGKILK